MPCNFATVGSLLSTDDPLLISTLNNDHLLIQNNTGKAFSGVLKIYSLHGIPMITSGIAIAGGSTAQVDCSSLVAGCYLAELQSDGFGNVCRIFFKE